MLRYIKKQIFLRNGALRLRLLCMISRAMPVGGRFGIMAMSADRRAAQQTGASLDAEPPIPMTAANLFAPISTANRITGNSRVRRPRAPGQLTPGSSYDYGRDDGWLAEAPDAPMPAQPDAPTYQMPGAFLRRTMPAPAAGQDAPAMGYGLHGLPTPETLMQTYTAMADAPQPAQDSGAYPGAGGLTPRAANATRADLPSWYTAPRRSESVTSVPVQRTISGLSGATPARTTSPSMGPTRCRREMGSVRRSL